jgi:DNA-binding IclR family transcriptional regulator
MAGGSLTIAYMEPIPPMEKPLAAPDSSAPALTRGLSLVELLDAAPEGLTLTQLSDAIDCPKNSTLRLIQALVDQGWAVRDPATLRVRLTSKVLLLGQPRNGDHSLTECALPVMRELRDQSGETVSLGILIGSEVVIIEKQESRLPVRIGVDVGLRLALHDNAPGKALIAFQQEEERKRLLAEIPLPATTPHTITDRRQLRNECEQIRKQGYAFDRDENYEGIRCVASPIFDRPGHVVAVIWFSGPSKRLPDSVLSGMASLVTTAAKRIEERLHL